MKSAGTFDTLRTTITFFGFESSFAKDLSVFAPAKINQSNRKYPYNFFHHIIAIINKTICIVLWLKFSIEACIDGK